MLDEENEGKVEKKKKYKEGKRERREGNQQGNYLGHACMPSQSQKNKTCRLFEGLQANITLYCEVAHVFHINMKHAECSA